MITRNCPISNCTNLAHNQTICKKHWYQINKFGKPITTQFDKRHVVEKETHLEIPLWSKTGVKSYALVDKEDRYIGDYKWNHSDTGYARGTIDGKLIKMHRMIMNAPDGVQIDHISRDKLDNRKANLRLCTIAENNYNRGPQANNTSGYKGVYRRGQRWFAKIVKNRKQIHLGMYDDPKEAAKAYDMGALKYFGDYAKLNFERNK